jgi:hypothetical protein
VSSDPTPNQPSSAAPANRFTDRKGREWHLELDYSKLRAIRSATSIDLGDVERFGMAWAQLLASDEKLLDVLWLTVGDRHADLQREEFEAGFDGEVLELARDSLLEAAIFFTQPAKRAMVTKASRTLMAGYRQAIREAEGGLDAAMQDVTTRGLKARGKKRPRSPGSSATSTTAGRSGKRSSR